MKRSTASRASALAAVALVLPAALSACADGAPASASPRTSGPASPASSVAPSTPDPVGAGAGTFGPGCSAIPTSGDGSFGTMATRPVATAAAGDPLLRTLAAALTETGLARTMDAAAGLTVLAPTDDAFAKLPSQTLDEVLADRALLTRLLRHHVIRGRLAPDQLAGRHTTLAGDTLEVAGSGEDFTVTGNDAHVLCGNIPTANATVYLIDTVLVPRS
jgi:uncharacterized surface protein with fasciclin (FAS1) repeats